ncbi:MAG: translation initiation factor IF-1 [Anaerolineae bacterium]|nr:translation initiation factor IF-1 [Anaerolineae bacterium]
MALSSGEDIGPDDSAHSRVRTAGVAKVLPNGLYLLALDEGGEVRAHLGGEMRLHSVRLLPGERVEVELAPFDPGRGRILRKV